MSWTASVSRCLATLLFAVVAGCFVGGGEVYRLELEMRQLEHLASSDDVTSDERTNAAEFRLGASEVYWIAEDRMRVDVHTVERRADGETETPTRSVATQWFDFDTREQWTLRGETVHGNGIEKQLFSEREYELENEWRRSRVDWFDVYLTSSMSPESASRYAGDRPLAVSHLAQIGDQRQIVQVKTQPGIYWEVTLDGDLARELPPWVAAHCLFSALGLSQERSAQIVSVLRGFPREITGFVAPDASGQTVVSYSVRRLERAAPQSEALEPPKEYVESVRSRELALSSADAIIDALESDRLPRGVRPSTAIHLLRIRGESRHAERLRRLWDRTDEFEQKVDLMRAGLRLDPRATYGWLERELESAVGIDAMASAEALFAEEHARAAEAVLTVLRRRATYTDLQRGTVEPWAVGLLRVASGIPIEELRREFAVLSERANLGNLSDDARGHERLGAEVDYWLRWGERAETFGGAPPAGASPLGATSPGAR